MKNFLYSVFLLTGLVAATACKRTEPTPDPGPPIIGYLDGTQQVPMVTTAARGTITGTFDKASSIFKYSVTYSGLTPLGAHFHTGAPGANGPIAIELPKNNAAKDGYVSPIEGAFILSAANATALLSNGIYVNLHTTAYPNGEIRGNITIK